MTLRSPSGHVFHADSRNVPASGTVTVLIRPERMALHETPAPGTAPATVTSALFMGETLRIGAVMEGGETLLIRSPDTATNHLPEPGSRIHVGWGPQDCWVLA